MALLYYTPVPPAFLCQLYGSMAVCLPVCQVLSVSQSVPGSLYVINAVG